MTRLSWRLLAVRLGGLVALVALAVLVLRLPSLAPVGGVVDAPAPDLEDPLEPITCERTLPGAPSQAGEEAVDLPRPVGRATSAALVECPDRFDGRAVSYVGEVVGDVLEREGGAWVLMNDDAYALEVGPLKAHGRFRGPNSGVSVWLAGELAELADEPGRADRRGDVLRVRGIVHRVDPADGGGLTIRASAGELVADARRVDTPLHVPQAVTAAVLALLAAGVVVAGRMAERRR